MTAQAQIFVLVIAVVGFLAILWLVRRGNLKERFALLWLGIGAGLIVLVAVRPLLDRLSDALGIRSGTTTLFILAILFVLGLILHLSLTLSRLEERTRDLAEAVGLLDAQLRERSVNPEAGSSQSASAIEPPDQGKDKPHVPDEEPIQRPSP